MNRFIAILAITFACLSIRAQSDSIWMQGWNALTANTGTLNGDTNWVDIPYIAYDLTTHKTGWGDAFLHYVANNLWVGLRYEDLDGVQATAGVQGQLQVTKQIGWFSYTPFLETSVGIGTSSTYGNAGPGLLISLHQFQWRWPDGQWALGIGVAGDFEHYVFNSAHNGNKVDAGAILNVSFP